MTGSFVHLHIGIDATGLPDDLETHYSVINNWDPIDAPQNHVIISIPSTLDPSLAPPGCHVIHAYAAANEVRGDSLMHSFHWFLNAVYCTLVGCALYDTVLHHDPNPK